MAYLKSVIFDKMIYEVNAYIHTYAAIKTTKLIHKNKKNRILIVNGDLEKNGFIVDTFTDPLVALNNFRVGLYAMVVLEKKMSKINPVYLHKKFKEIDEEVRICILSSSEIY